MSVQYVYKQSDQRESGILYAWFSAMHTRVDMILCHKTEEELKSMAHRIKEELTQLEKSANFYDPASELYRVNTAASGSFVTVSTELYTMIETALQYRLMTRGLFDITIQSANYNKDTARNVKLSQDSHSIYFQQPGLRIDLSGFLKGYALDKVRKILEDHNITHALVSLGNSSVLALGNHPHGNGWKVGFNGQTGTTGTESLTLHNQCLTTSGNDSKERKHIIDPQTGSYVEGVKQVAVVTPTGVEGEVLSTSLFIATPGQWDKLIKSFRIERAYRFDSLNHSITNTSNHLKNNKYGHT